MGWLNAALAILSKFLGWQEAKAQERVATVDDRRKEAAQERKSDAVNEAETRIKERSEALAAYEDAVRRGDSNEARKHMATVERLQRERDRV